MCVYIALRRGKAAARLTLVRRPPKGGSEKGNPTKNHLKGESEKGDPTEKGIRKGGSNI